MSTPRAAQSVSGGSMTIPGAAQSHSEGSMTILGAAQSFSEGSTSHHTTSTIESNHYRSVCIAVRYHFTLVGWDTHYVTDFCFKNYCATSGFTVSVCDCWFIYSPAILE